MLTLNNQRLVCIITGGNGYVGSHVTRYLVNKGWECHLLVRISSDLSNLDGIRDKVFLFSFNTIVELIDHFCRINPTVVFHIGAAIFNENEKDNISKLIQSNVQLGTEVLEAMVHSSCRLIVNTGTYWQSYKSNGYNPLDLYAATKEAFEKIIQYYIDAYDVRALTLRLYDIFGEDDNRPKLWTTLRNIAGTNKKIDISPGEQMLELVHISDVVSAYEIAYEILRNDNKVRNKVYGVYSGEFHTLKEWIFAYQKAIGKPINVNYGGKMYRKREMMIPSRALVRLPLWKKKRSISNIFMDLIFYIK